jgi:hypothetical protein
VILIPPPASDFGRWASRSGENWMSEESFFLVKIRAMKIFKILAKLFLGAMIIFMTTSCLQDTGALSRNLLDDPPFPKGVIVNYEETSTRTWYSGNNPSSETYIWRKEFIVGLNCCEELNSSEEILAFLEKWLLAKGWVHWKGTGDPCANMSETEFLDREISYVPYLPSGKGQRDLNLNNTPSVCVAVWPWTESSFSVLLVTANK